MITKNVKVKNFRFNLFSLSRETSRKGPHLRLGNIRKGKNFIVVNSCSISEPIQYLLSNQRNYKLTSSPLLKRYSIKND